jgi:hypothetical protein
VCGLISRNGDGLLFGGRFIQKLNLQKIFYSLSNTSRKSAINLNRISIGGWREAAAAKGKIRLEKKSRHQKNSLLCALVKNWFGLVID